MSDLKIKIDTDEAIRYMGYRATPDENQMDMIIECRDLLEKEVTPAWVYRAFDLEFTDEGVKLKGTRLVFRGKDIRQHLADCEKCILLCATASAKADELIRRKETEDIALGFMTDCLASAAVESVCNALEEELAKKLDGWNFTWRFSPGYGDFPLSVQPQIIKTLDAEKRAGVTCTATQLLIPRKSVTAVIGLSRNPVNKGRRGCAVCKMAGKCEFRKRGTHCGV
jgi:5-methyltetrahydrofolate--homocysteine methyltransferase